MTIEEKVAIYEMRLRGATLQECADRFGVSKEWIRNIAPNTGIRGHRKKCYEGCIYPNLSEWLRENRYSYTRFARVCTTSTMSMHNYLNGKGEIPKRIIDHILDFTGMTYEEAFYEEKKSAPSVADSKAANGNNLP